MSKRGPIIIVGIIVLLLLVTPFAIGMVNENAMRRELDNLPPQSIYEASIESFDRGWFSSTVDINISPSRQYFSTLLASADPTLAGLANFELPVVVEISHGPILLDDGLRFGTASVRAFIDPESELSTLAVNIVGMPYLFEFRGHAGFGSGFTYEGEIPGADFALPDVSVNWAPVEFSGFISQDTRSFNGKLDSASLQSPFAGAILESLTVANESTTERPDRVPVGSFALSLGRVTLSDPLRGAAPIFSAEEAGFGFSSEQSDDGARLSAKAAYSVGALSIGGEFEISEAEIGMAVNDLDAAASFELRQAASAISASGNADQALQRLTPAIDRLLAGAPSIDIDPIEFSTPEGRLSGTAHAAFDPGALPNGTFADLMNPEVAQSALNGEIDVMADKPLAQRIATLVMADQLPQTSPAGQPIDPDQLANMAAGQATLMLGMLSAQGIVVDTGDSFRARIEFRDGQLLANGQPLGLGL
jgi:uncharacterized protein YdgA (DUF945 family)